MDRAVELGMQALALTDHGNLYGAIEFYNAAKAKGIKPLIGCELYLVENSRLEKHGRSDDEARASSTSGCSRKNLTGYQNLLKLVSDAHLKGFYYKPRTDLETLAKYSERADRLHRLPGVARAAALAARPLRGGAQGHARRFVEIFGRENYFVEIQDHGIPEQRKIIPGLLKLAEEFNLKVICTNDVHYVRADDSGPHDAMLCIQTGAKIEDEKRMRFDGTQFYLKSRDEMAKLFAEVPESRHQHPARRRNVRPGDSVSEGQRALSEISAAARGQNRPRRLPAASSASPACKTALRRATTSRPAGRNRSRRYPACAEELLVERMDYELSIISNTGFIDYFLVVWDFIDWATTARHSRSARAAARAPAASSPICSASPTSIRSASSCSSSASSIPSAFRRPTSTSISACAAAAR